MARTYKTLSLSLPPRVVDELTAMGQSSGRTGARVAAEIVLRAVAEQARTGKERRARSWCCDARVVPLQGPLVLLDGGHSKIREWIPVVVLLCGVCKKQLHGREYEGWIDKG